jgi:pentose-5-phosphate-3-epimerase
MDEANLKKAKAAGANHFVIGSALFRDGKIRENIRKKRLMGI